LRYTVLSKAGILFLYLRQFYSAWFRFRILGGNNYMAEAEISSLDKILSQSNRPAEEMDKLYMKYQELSEHHNQEMNMLEQYTHDVEVFLKNNS